MEVTYNTKFLLRRGTAEAWERNNPVLSYGEPGYDSTNYGLKIGDGVTHWNDLAFISGERGMVESAVFNAKTQYEFPSIGKSNIIYKAEEERKIYQWNSTSLKYETLSEVEIKIEDLDSLSTILENYILNIDYDTLLSFDVSEIVVGTTNTTSVLGKAILGQLVLA